MSDPIPKGEVCVGDMTEALDSRFLNAVVLQGSLEKRKKQTLPVTIDRVEHLEKIKYENGKTDVDVYLLYFAKSDKPLKLSKTNIKRLIMQLGTIGANWQGKKIELGLEQDRRPDLGGKLGPCVRVLEKAMNPPSDFNPFQGGGQP